MSRTDHVTDALKALGDEKGRRLVGARVREARGFDRTQKEFADLVGTRQSLVARWETGRTLPSTRSIYRMAHVLNRDPLWFVAEYDGLPPVIMAQSEEEGLIGRIDVKGQKCVILDEARYKRMWEVYRVAGPMLALGQRSGGGQVLPISASALDGPVNGGTEPLTARYHSDQVGFQRLQRLLRELPQERAGGSEMAVAA